VIENDPRFKHIEVGVVGFVAFNSVDGYVETNGDRELFYQKLEDAGIEHIRRNVHVGADYMQRILDALDALDALDGEKREKPAGDTGGEKKAEKKETEGE
jgi:hypothetical protein